MISIFSVIAGTLWLNIALLIVFFLRKRMTIMVHYSSRLLALIAILALVRILVPLDLKQAYVVNSWHILPAIRDFLQWPVFGGITLWQILVIIWGTGSVIVLLREIQILIKDHQQRQNYRTTISEQARRAAERCGLSPKNILVSPDVSSPMVVGFFTYMIYLPELELSDDDLFWILRHEQQHIQSKDSWLKLFYLFLQVLFWWNPVVVYFQKELDTILELRCDQAILAERTDAERLAYSEALLHVAQQLYTKPNRYPASTTTFARFCSDAALTTRVELILNGNRRHTAINFLLTALCFAVFFSSYFVLIQTAGAAPPIEDEIIITADNAYLVREGENRYVLWFNGTPVNAYTKDQIESRPLCDMEIIEATP